MRPDNRFDRLESDIVDALRRAPGATPSADLDARILARAHAAVSTPKRRPQPIWFSMAAGLVLLVGSGLALRIWQQVEHAPSALDMPAAKVGAPAKTSAEQDGSAAGASTRASAESAPGALERQQKPAAREPEAKGDASAPASAVAASPAANVQSIQPSRENPPTSAAKLEGASGSPAAPAIAEEMRDAPDMATARPFPAEPEATVASAPAASPPAEQAPERVVQPVVSAPAPAVVAAQPAAPPTPAPPPAIADDLGVLDITEPQRQLGADAEKATGFAATGSMAGATDALAARDRADEADQSARAAREEGPVDAYTGSLTAVRKALAAGDEVEARRLLAQLRRAFPDRELPEDLRSWADQPQ